MKTTTLILIIITIACYCIDIFSMFTLLLGLAIGSLLEKSGFNALQHINKP